MTRSSASPHETALIESHPPSHEAWQVLHRLATIVSKQHEMMRLAGLVDTASDYLSAGYSKATAFLKATTSSLADTGGFLDNKTLFVEEGGAKTLIQTAIIPGQSISLRDADNAQNEARAELTTRSAAIKACVAALKQDSESYNNGGPGHTSEKRQALVAAQTAAEGEAAKALEKLNTAKKTVEDIVKAVRAYAKAHPPPKK